MIKRQLLFFTLLIEVYNLFIIYYKTIQKIQKVRYYVVVNREVHSPKNQKEDKPMAAVFTAAVLAVAAVATIFVIARAC